MILLEIPLHPLVVHFPIALLFVAAGFYIASLFSRQPWLSTAGLILHLLGVLACAVAIVTGGNAEGDAVQTEAIHEMIEKHELLGWVCTWIFSALAIWAFLRYKQQGKGERWVFTLLFVLSLSTVIATAHEGGELVYEKGVGVEPMRKHIELQRNAQ